MEHQYGLFIKFSSLQVQNDFYHSIPFKNQLHYEEKNGICQEHIWKYLRKNKLPYLLIEKFLAKENCQITCAEFKQDLKAWTEYYISSDANQFKIVCQTEPFVEKSKSPPPPPPTPPSSPKSDSDSESKPWQGRLGNRLKSLNLRLLIVKVPEKNCEMRLMKGRETKERKILTGTW